jgi:hypothetical protein
LYGRIHPSLANLYALNVSENAPLWLLWSINPRYVWAYVAVTIGAAAACACAWRQVRGAHALLLAVFAYLGFSAERNLLLYFMVAAPILAVVLGRCSPPRVMRGDTGIMIALVVLFATVSLHGLTHYAVLRVCPKTSALSPFRHPTGIADYLRRHPVEGRIFNDVRYGGYLLWKCHPPTQVFIDGRLIIRSPSFFARYLAALDTPATFDALAREYGITHVAMPTAIFPRCLGLARRLNDDASWAIAHADDASILFVVDSLCPTQPIDLRSPAHAAALIDSTRTAWRDDPAIRREALGYLATLFAVMGAEENAVRVRAAANNR